MSLVDKFGRPIANNVQVKTAYVVIEGLPTWCVGVLYNGTDDVLMLRVEVDLSDRIPYADHVQLNLEMTPAQARALVDAFSQCLTRSEQTVLDVPVEQTS